MPANRLFVRPYKGGSASAKTLADTLGAKRLKLEGSNYKPRDTDVVINWGNSSPFRGANVLNQPAAIALASNKLRAFETMFAAGVPVPPFTVDAGDAAEWKTICVREKLTGHSGEGLTVVEAADFHERLQRAPLFTKYIPKKDEYRIHVGKKADGSLVTIFKQRKARRHDVPDADVNWKIRNHANGFIFAHQDINVPGQVMAVAHSAVEALGLDFGAVDVIVNEKSGMAYVLEVNTACGLEGATVDAYANFFREYARG